MAQHRSAVRELDPVPAELVLKDMHRGRKESKRCLASTIDSTALLCIADVGNRVPDHTLLLNSHTLSPLSNQPNAPNCLLTETL